MIKVDKNHLELKGDVDILVSETQIIIESLLESMDIVDRYIFMRTILNTLNRGMDKEKSNN